MAQKIDKLNTALANAKAKFEGAKTDAEKEAATKAIENIQKQIDALNAAGDNTEGEGKPSVKKAKTELSIMDKYKVDELFVNSKGSYFTSRNLAELSEKDKKNIKTLTREAVESKIK